MTTHTESDATVASGSPDAENVAARLIRFLGTLEGAEDVFAPDVFVDLNVPLWRRQVQGPDAVESLIREETDDGYAIGAPGRPHPHRLRPGVRGRVHQQGKWPGLLLPQRLAVRGPGRADPEITIYCTGKWDEEARRKQAEEAPMLRK